MESETNKLSTKEELTLLRLRKLSGFLDVIIETLGENDKDLEELKWKRKVHDLRNEVNF